MAFALSSNHCPRQPLQTATADRTPDNYAGRTLKTLLDVIRINWMAFALSSNHCPRRCIYETVINPSALYERYVDLLTHMCESARME